MVEVIKILFQYFSFSLRDIEKFFTIISIYYSSLPRKQFTIPIIIGFLAVIKVRFPDIFYKLSGNNIDYNELDKKLELSSIPIKRQDDNTTKNWFISLLEYFLLTDEEYEQKQEDNKINDYSRMFNRYKNIDRNNAISILCKKLTLFKIP